MKKYPFIVLLVVIPFCFNAKVFALEDISNIVIDYDNPVRISVTIRDQHYGPVVVNGRTKVFGASFVQRTGETKICDFRYAAFKDGKIVQIYDGAGEVTLENRMMYDIKLPCYINLPEGEYLFLPIVKIQGENMWRLPNKLFSTFVKNGYWKLYVYANHPAPSSEYMNFPDANGKGDSEYTVYHAYQNEKFRVQMALVNNTRSVMNGKIKIMWERNLAKYWRGMKYDFDDVKTEWKICATNLARICTSKAENGGIPVSIATNGKLDVMIEDCFISEYYDYGERWSPFLVAYYLPEGKEDIEENWLVVNDNTDFCFDENMNLLTDRWDHALNYLAFVTFEGSATGTESLDISRVGLNYSKATGAVALSNVPQSSFVRVVDLNGRLLQTESASDNSIRFTLKAGSGLNIVSLYNYDGRPVKSFKVIR